MYTGKTKKLGVIGYPISHSLSPVIHNAYLQAHKLDYIYMALQVEPKILNNSLELLGQLGFVGLNVTIPHKVAVMSQLASIDEAAQTIGAVNTLVWEENSGWHGYNTDAFGFAYPLQSYNLQGTTAAVLGCGGAARAVVYALGTLGVTKIYLMVRNMDKGLAFAKTFPKMQIEVVPLADTTADYWQDLALIVNTTPLGMTGKKQEDKINIPWAKLNPKAIIYDLIYTPAKTNFLLEAEQHNHKIINGEIMLAAQGGKALELWSKKEINIPFMIENLRNYLSQINN